MRRYKYQREDFDPLPVQLEHLDIELDFRDGEVHAATTLRMTARQLLREIRLDARELTIHAVEWIPAGAEAAGLPVAYELREAEHALLVMLPEDLAAGQPLVLRTRSTCVPSDNILDGIYKDTTPPGCPQQYMSQCQQWGFQRIMPILDDCTAKCTMTTRLEADSRYTHLISNGNISPLHNPDGKPIPCPDDPSRQMIVYENPIPMAPYLFIAAVGTWDMLEDEVVYPSGKRVKLEYLVPPGQLDGARIPMEILKSAVLWQNRALGYEYRHDVYRTICMEKSNFGGMENVGNTTIVTSAAMVDEWTGDARLEYAYGVIVHEFEHNQCGSDVTMETPFDMWLNEAFTVDVERRFTAEQFDPVCMRLTEVDRIRAPIGGPLSIEDAGHMGNIVRAGFNDPDELVDGVTYVKAPEVIRMLRMILGDAVFRKAQELYFDRYNGGNANTDQFFACFEEVSGRDLAAFKQQWLHTIGYPRIRAEHAYDPESRTLSVTLTQERAGQGALFQAPVALAAVDAEGEDIPGTAVVAEVSGAELSLVFRDVDAPAFLSYNRDSSFYGTFEDRSSGPDQWLVQSRKDPNLFNRVEAMRRLTDRERLQLIHDASADISRDWIDAWGEILEDMSLHPGVKAYLLRVDEQSLDRSTLPLYRERYAARRRLLRQLADCHGEALARVFAATDTRSRGAEPRDGINERALKATLLRTLIEANSPAVYALAEEHFHRAWNISDRVAALQAINLSDHPRRRELLAEAYDQWHGHLNGYTSYLMVVSSSPHEDVFERVAEEAARDSFHIEHPSHNRALFVPMTGNNKMLWTAQGIDWVAARVLELASVSEATAIGLVNAFQQVHNLAEDLKPRVIAALARMRDGISADAHPAVAGRIAAYLGRAQDDR